jgi:class 3 adenylate cyclase
MPFTPRRISQEWEIDAPVPLVWEVLGQTDRLNRESGLPSIQVSSFEDEAIGRPVQARLYRVIPLSWVEYPFEWVRGRSYSVQRDYTKGPLARFRGGVELEPSGAGCRVRIFAELTPRNLLGQLAVPLVVRETLRKARDYCRKAVERLRSPLPASPAPPPASLPPSVLGPSKTDRALLQQRARRLEEAASLDRRILGLLARHLAEAGDDEVVRMQPYALAARWGTERAETLRVFLHATKAGLLNLVWDLMCPNCRVPKVEADSLSLVTRRFHCDTCGIDYDANFDRYVELRFRVHPAIRQAQDHVYCFGGPYSAPHILVQYLLRPGDAQDLSATLEDEAYRIRTLRVNHSTLLVPTAHEATPFAPFTYRERGWERTEAAFHPGLVHLRWTNQGSKLIGVVLERVRWDEQAVPAAKVATMQEFRDLFSSEVLAPGQGIGVEAVTILFSDLKESTRLYEEAGDAPAYGHVRRHFDFLKERVGRCRGAVVKTIGDAVMASFHQPVDAVRCCLEIQRDIESFNRSLPDRRPLVVKLGVHHGPAIAINANGRLDYFGRTVNVASRILRESRGGDVVMARELAEESSVSRVLAEEKASVVAEWTAPLKGVAGPLTLCRVRRP